MNFILESYNTVFKEQNGTCRWLGPLAINNEGPIGSRSSGLSYSIRFASPRDEKLWQGPVVIGPLNAERFRRR